MTLKELEKQFHDALAKTNDISVSRCQHDPKRIKIMMAEMGARQTAKKLMASDPSTSGYLKMAECGCLDITIEATMLRPEFAPLFTKQELREARRRLPENIVDVVARGG
jgi:hypothetical protein